MKAHNSDPTEEKALGKIEPYISDSDITDPALDELGRWPFAETDTEK